MTSTGTRPEPAGGRRLAGALLGVAATVAVIVLTYVLFDRDAATWTHATFRATGAEARLLPVFIDLTHIVDPLAPVAAVGFLGLGAVLVGSRAPDLRLQAAFAACTATLVALAVKDQLKFDFGRMWPETWVNNNPSWIANGAFGFSPLHGGVGWSSFPSGHMTVVSAPMVVLMLAFPGWRLVPVVPILLVAVGLFGADYHFLSDMLAGLLLGTVCALIVWSLVMPRDASGASRRRP